MNAALTLGRRFSIVALAAILVSRATVPSAEPVSVQHVEGQLHGFLALRSPDGHVLASGALIQDVRGDQVTAHLLFRFRDGSSSDETAVFSQHGHFALISDHLVQKGPAFAHQLDMTIDRPAGHVVVRYKNDRGVEKVEDEHMSLPPDLANGIITTLLKNVRREALPPSVSLLAATPKPRLVKLIISVAGTEPFSIAGSTEHATHYVLKVALGGIAGVVAPLVGKQPPDSHVWIMEGESPAFLRSRSQMFADAPLWQIELTSPAWPPV